MRRAMAAMLALFLCAGCAHDPARNEDGPAHVAGVRQDLSGIREQALKGLVKVDVRQGKVFLYASQYTDSPVVDRGDVAFAVQFKTSSVTGGFREASIFNAYMLEYMRRQLQQGICPEHPGVPLVPAVSGAKKTGYKGGKYGKKRAAAQGPVLVCPCDNRQFFLDRKVAGERK